ncbi:PREDICTED: alpha-tocopherol transfer protein [Dinoponera quadriceps]|uniref:Alpha-tocopherol transfer protein n=1 Tax=Dinoponera quadriceps TaxID=609295 RepID=A0A6P3WU57_DINQU|nr:PREDICTED: alpha-tocopherol transfer protein [Dinoponera quadriceps]
MLADMTESRYEDDDVVRQLTSEEKEYAAKYLNETDEGRANAVAEIRRWLLENDNMCSRTDEFFILRFLRACKFDIEKAKAKMRNYHQQRSDLPEWFANKDPFLPELQQMFDLGVFLPLRKLDNQERMVIIVRPTLHDPYKQQISDVLKVCMIVFDLSSRSHVSGSLRGVFAIIDMQGVRFGHALQLRPNVIKSLVHSWQGCCPIRIQSINFINVPIYVDVVLSIFKQFMNAKLKQRLYISRQGVRNSCRELPTEILPTEYGGTDCSLQELKEYWKKMAIENRDWLANDEKYKMLSESAK